MLHAVKLNQYLKFQLTEFAVCEDKEVATPTGRIEKAKLREIAQFSKEADVPDRLLALTEPRQFLALLEEKEV